MSLASALHEEIARKRKAMEELKGPSGTRKFVTRGEIERERERKYFEEQKKKKDVEVSQLISIQ